MKIFFTVLITYNFPLIFGIKFLFGGTFSDRNAKSGIMREVY